MHEIFDESLVVDRYELSEEDHVNVALIEEKGFEIIGEFSCLGFDTALTKEGINKGRPNKQDIKDAEDFIINIIKK